jgi:hypothetical protein
MIFPLGDLIKIFLRVRSCLIHSNISKTGHDLTRASAVSLKNPLTVRRSTVLQGTSIVQSSGTQDLGLNLMGSGDDDTLLRFCGRIFAKNAFLVGVAFITTRTISDTAYKSLGHKQKTNLNQTQKEKNDDTEKTGRDIERSFRPRRINFCSNRVETTVSKHFMRSNAFAQT